ncbi:MAG TPA: PilZ domain-containing protein [Kofleriaceae bacterium]|nr:PilZ domain-containing protein [Kofleriaceae bacterium]
MSRRHPRVRTQFTATLRLEGSELRLACPTRDVSSHGCFLDTAEDIPLGTEVDIACMDNLRGEAIELAGRVARRVPPGADGRGGGLGIAIAEPSDEWLEMVQRFHDLSGPRVDPSVLRLRVLVVGDADHRRGALALYVRSGWDVRFASDLDGAVEALESFEVNAVIAEHDLDDQRWPAVLGAARDLRPQARRIVRASLGGQPAPESTEQDLVHRVVDLDAGLDALLDAITADF